MFPGSHASNLVRTTDRASLAACAGRAALLAIVSLAAAPAFAAEIDLTLDYFTVRYDPAAGPYGTIGAPDSGSGRVYFGQGPFVGNDPYPSLVTGTLRARFTPAPGRRFVSATVWHEGTAYAPNGSYAYGYLGYRFLPIASGTPVSGSFPPVAWCCGNFLWENGGPVGGNPSCCTAAPPNSASLVSGIPLPPGGFVFEQDVYASFSGGGYLYLGALKLQIVTEPIPPCTVDYNRDTALNLDDLSDFITDFYSVPSIPGGLQPLAPTYESITLGYGLPCPAAGNAPPPYVADAYITNGYRVGFSTDGSNSCPADPGQTFPNLDHLSDFITAYYAAFTGGGC